MADQKSNLPATTDSLAGDFLKKIGESLKGYAIRKYEPNIFFKSAMMALVNNKDLSEALRSDQGRMSIFSALRYAASTGLSLNPQEGKAALIGYKNKAGALIVNYQIMKNGMVELALESGKIEFLSADYVKQNDKFSLTKTVNGDDYIFSPALADRGEIIGFFAALKLKTGATYVKWFTKSEIEEIRDKYSRQTGDESAWAKSFTGMGIKTVMKSLLRSISISNDLDTAIATDDFFEADFHVGGVTADIAGKKLDDKKVNKPVEAKESDSLL